jgi:ATP-dependent Zn protease
MVMLGHGHQLSFSSERDPEAFHEEREAILREAYELADSIIAEHEDALSALADKLVETPTLLGDDVHTLFEEMGV